MPIEGRQAGKMGGGRVEEPGHGGRSHSVTCWQCDLRQIPSPVSACFHICKKLLYFPLLQLSQAYLRIIIMIIIVIMAATYSFSKFLISTCCGPGPVLGAGNSSMNKTDKNLFLVERTTFVVRPTCSVLNVAFYICNVPLTERNFTGISFGLRAALKREGILCSILLLQKVRRSRSCELPRVSQCMRGGDGTWTLDSGPRPGS